MEKVYFWLIFKDEVNGNEGKTNTSTCACTIFYNACSEVLMQSLVYDVLLIGSDFESTQKNLHVNIFQNGILV